MSEKEESEIFQIGARVKRSRLERKLTQKNLAEMVMVSPSCITRLENGQTMVSVLTLVEISSILQVPMTDLVFGEATFEMRELEKLSQKLRKCPREQRKAIILSFESLLDAIF